MTSLVLNNWALIVSLVFSHLGFWSGNLFLIASFPDLCLLVPFHLPLHSGVEDSIVAHVRYMPLYGDRALDKKTFLLFVHMECSWFKPCLSRNLSQIC